jgi:hypothetical protein
MPQYQGGLDWLCGPYAVINALELCGSIDQEEAFKTALQSLHMRRWPNVMWTGTGIGELSRMATACIAAFDLVDTIKISQPFKKKPPLSDHEYWDRFDELFSSEGHAVCTIIRTLSPNDYWVVAKPGGKTRIEFIDSYEDWPKRRLNRAKLFAGIKKPNKASHLIVRNELLLFTRTA